jgi:large subunit ribosomal protein L35
MPKQKTHKGLSKRVRVSKKGKIKFRHVGTGHLLSAKSSSRRRKLRKKAVMHTAEEKKVFRLLRINPKA